MGAGKGMLNMIDAEMKRLRLEAKALENAGKPMLDSADVRETKDFVFSRFQPFEKIGESGPLFIAKQKENRCQRYLIKHYYADSAANEFVYTKLAQAMDLKMPNAVLFHISEGEKRKYWHIEYVLGTDFLDLVVENPGYQLIREKAKNWEDYFRFMAMYRMCNESDTFETPLASDECIYRVDTTASFILKEAMLANAGVTQRIGDSIPAERVKEYINWYKDFWRFPSFQIDLESCIGKYGKECKRPYIETFGRLLGVRDDYIDEFLNTLCYFYPDYIGDYFKEYIRALKAESEGFLKLYERF